jgi:hypothetical protein
MTREELAQDLAYVRTLAEEGRHAPLLGGAMLLFWGILNPSAYLLHYGLLTGVLPGGEPGWGFAVLWATYGTVAGVSMAVLGRRWRDKPGQSSLGVRAEKAVWSGVGWAIGIVAIGCIGRMALENDTLAPNAIMAPALALLGTALTTTALMAREKWLLGFATIAFVSAALIGVFANQPWAYLAAAAANAIVLVIPGIVLLRREPATIV